MDLVESAFLEEEPQVFTLTDEDGVEKQFEFFCDVEYDGNTYVALIPFFENEEEICEEENDLIILKCEIEEETGLQILVSIDSDDEYEKVGHMIIDEISQNFERIKRQSEE